MRWTEDEDGPSRPKEINLHLLITFSPHSQRSSLCQCVCVCACVLFYCASRLPFLLTHAYKHHLMFTLIPETLLVGEKRRLESVRVNVVERSRPPNLCTTLLFSAPAEVHKHAHVPSLMRHPGNSLRARTKSGGTIKRRHFCQLLHERNRQ